MSNYFAEKSLLRPPTERAAFSDRQAYVCAELSKLAYFKFEGGHTIDEILLVAKQIIGENDKYEALEQQIRNMLGGSPEATSNSKDAFAKILNAADFRLVDTFDEKGTQAFLCARTFERTDRLDKTVAYLVFRGTEPKDFRDIKTDINARLISVPVGSETIEFHSGYVKALDQIIKEVTTSLEKTPHEQLIVSGHSLGGALAIVYTRRYAASVNGACYTFGAPPVGAIEVQNGLKTPVYEIINELDIVPNLPNPWLGSITIVLLKILRLVAKAFTVTERILASGAWDEKLEGYVEMMTRYRHPGYKSYLVGSESAARLRYNLGLYDKLRLWTSMIFKKRFSRFNKLVSDHMIDVYIDKLKHHALKRN